MCSYGDFGKALQRKIEESLNNAINNVTFPEYNKFVSDTVLEALNGELNEQSKAKITNILKEKLQPAPAVMTGKELLEKIKEFWFESTLEGGHDEIEIEWSDSYGMHLVIKHPECSSETLKMTCYDHKKTGEFTIGYLHQNQRGVLSGTVEGSTGGYGLERYLYQLYCAETKIIDINDVYGDNIYVEREYY